MAKRHIAEDIFKSKFRWPKFGDQLFRADGENNKLAELELSGSKSFFISEGFKQAADIAVEKAITGDNLDKSTLVYPIVFNYRHFIELSLKSLLQRYGPEVGVKSNWNTHDLEKLWKSFSGMLDAYGTADPDDIDSVIFECIAEFSKIDPFSFSFRYPTDKKGKEIKFDDAYLNLENLRDVMTAISNYFTGCDGYLDSLVSAAPSLSNLI